jgi:hypothetical protein
MTAGPTCDTCGKDEGTCAWDRGCCAGCTHTFGEVEQQELTCEACGNVWYRDKQLGRIPVTCDDCRAKEHASQLINSSDYDLYVAETGTAHYHVAPQAISTCGKMRGHPDNLPVQDWPTICRKCVRIMVKRAAA